MNTFHKKARITRQQKTANRLGLLVVAFMVFTAVFSTIGTIDPVVAAQPDCPEGQALDDAGECVDIVEQDDSNDGSEDDTSDDGEDDITDGGEDDANDDGGDNASDDGEDDGSDAGEDDITELSGEEAIGKLDIFKSECPSDADPENMSVDDAVVMCASAMNGIGFGLYSGSSGEAGTDTTDSSGYTGFDEIAADYHSLVENVPDGYGTPLVFCAAGESDASYGHFQRYTVTDGNTIGLDFSESAYFSCLWFNIPEGHDNDGITVNKYVCDSPQIVPGDDSLAMDDYVEYCNSPLDQYGVPGFDLADSVSSQNQNVGEQLPNGVFFNDFAYGEVTLKERVVEGFGKPVVYCGFVPEGGQYPETVAKMTVGEDWSISAHVEEGDEYLCYWFNMAEPGDGVDIHKWACPDGYLASDATYADLIANCTETLNDVEFEIRVPEGTTYASWTGTNGPGIAKFPGVFGNSLEIAETFPDGYADAIVYCGVDAEDSAFTPFNIEVERDTTGATFALSVEEFGHAVCHVFNIPQGDPELTIVKYFCDPGFEDISYAYDSYADNCTDTRSGVSFVHNDETKTTSTQSNSVSFFVDRSDSGNRYLGFQEIYPDGLYPPIIFCWLDGASAELAVPLRYEVSSVGVWSPYYAEGSRLTCHVFNIPAGEPDLTIRTFECPITFMPTEETSLGDYSNACDTPQAGVDFTYNSNGESVSATTENDGTIVVQSLAAGDYVLAETVPEGYQNLKSFCQNDGEEPYSVGLYEGQYIDFTIPDVAEPAPVTCWVVNIPDASDLTILAYGCAEDFVPTEEMILAAYQTACIQPMDQVGFSYTNGTDAGEGETDTNGVLLVNDIDMDAFYTVTEVVPEHYSVARVFCKITDVSEIGSPIFPGDALEVDINEGAPVTCYWFNQPNFPDVTIYKYWCDPAFNDPELDYTSLTNACEYSSHGGETFTVNGEEKVMEADSQDGLEWFDIPAGSVGFKESLGANWAVPIVECQLLNSANPPIRPVVTADGSWAVEFGANDRYSCLVFNFNGYADLTIYKYNCAEVFHPTDITTFNDFRLNCPDEMDDITFDYSNGTQSGTEITDNEGAIVVEDLDTGTLTITETVPDEYNVLRVFCTADNVLETSSVTFPGNSFEVNRSQDMPVLCYWFNYRDFPEVAIEKMWCDPTFNTPSATFNTLNDGCVRMSKGGETFSVNGDERVLTAGSEEVAEWNNLAPGALTIKETLQAEQVVPIVYCYSVADYSPAELVPVSTAGEWTLDLEEHNRFHCIVFNFEDNPDVILYKYYCDPTYTDGDYDLQWYSDNCTTTGTGTTFSVDGEQRVTGIDPHFGTEQNNVSWHDLEYGELALREAPEGAFGSPVVWCQTFVFNGTSEPMQQVAVSPESYEWTYAWNSDTLLCYVFNIPLDHDIIVHKYVCPPGYDYEDAAHEELLNACDTIAFPVDFGHGPTIDSLQTQATGSVIPGGIAIDDYDGGTYVISEVVPDGYDAPRVFCRVETETPDPIVVGSVDLTEYQVEDGRIILNEAVAVAAYDVGWYCDWFNFEASADTNDVLIYKWECPVFEGAWEDSHDFLNERCTNRMAGVEFTLDDIADPRSPLPTNDNGVVSWSDVNNGPVTISESIPDGYGQPSVFCAYTYTQNGETYNVPLQRYDAPDGVVTTALEYPNTEFTCDWYNFPDQSGEITIHKFWCPEGYDLQAYGADPVQDCSSPGDGIEFSLDGASKMTGNEGVVSWDDLEPGEYTIAETYPEGADSSFVLNCYGGRYVGIQPYPLQFGAELTVNLVAGDSITCSWFNVPDHDKGSITLYKYWCTTKTFVSDVDCQIYEGGVTFDLATYADGQVVDQKVTSQYGSLTFENLDDGDYTLREQGYEWCAIDISDKGVDESINVASGKEIVVKVYNCDLPDSPGDPDGPSKPPVKNPTRYPNTGVDPTALTLPATGAGDTQGHDVSMVTMLAIAAMLALAAGGFALRRNPDEVPQLGS